MILLNNNSIINNYITKIDTSSFDLFLQKYLIRKHRTLVCDE
jgi:hypothetical protein